MYISVCVCLHVYVCVYVCVAFKCFIQELHSSVSFNLDVLILHVSVIQKCECVWKGVHVKFRLSVVVIRVWVYGRKL